MASFGKLISRKDGRRSGSYCCSAAEARSLERRLQRPLLAKSRTLPSIPQSPLVGRTNPRDAQPRPRLPSSPAHRSACTLPPADDAWRLEDDSEGAGLAADSGVKPHPPPPPPLSQLQRRAAYLRKSASVDSHLGMSQSDPAHTEGRSSRSGKGKLKRKFVSESRFY